MRQTVERFRDCVHARDMHETDSGEIWGLCACAGGAGERHALSVGGGECIVNETDGGEIWGLCACMGETRSL